MKKIYILIISLLINSYSFTQTFTKVNIDFIGVNQASSDWGDYDNDGDLDLILIGYNGSSNSTYLYRNDIDTFVLVSTGITATRRGSVEWGDYDNDNDLDILITGIGYISWNNYSDVTEIFRNDGNDTFSELSCEFSGKQTPDVSWVDYDNDGDLDFINSGNGSTQLYRNDKSDNFTIITTNLLGNSQLGAVECADYDNDMDMDIYNGGLGISKLYSNNNNEFVETNVELPLPREGDAKWFDYDTDGDLDLILTGYDNGYITKIYTNEGNNIFTMLGQSFVGGRYSAVDIGDFDNDGDIDFIWTGEYTSRMTKIYENDNLNFIATTDSIAWLKWGDVNWVDYDNDGDLDVFVCGYTNSVYYSELYRNNGTVSNTKPEKVTGLDIEVIDSLLLFKWNRSDDNESGTKGLTYNLRVGTTSGGYNIVSPMSDENGFRKIVRMGNTNLDTSWVINIGQFLPLDSIYWSVQAIDNGYLGGEWSDERVDCVQLGARFKTDTICREDVTSFTDISYVATGMKLIAWKWCFGDGDSSIVQNPTHLYHEPGEYYATFIIYTNELSDTAVQKVIVKPKPYVNFIADTTCIGSLTSFTNLSDTSNLNITNWQWFSENELFSTYKNPNTFEYLDSGRYTVKLKLIAENACSDSIEKEVIVAEYPNAIITLDGATEYCVNDENQTKLIVENNNDYYYQWFQNGALLENSDTSIISIISSGTYKVDVINLIGECVSTSQEVNITALPSPTKPYISVNGETEFCMGDSVSLFTTENNEYEYKWLLNGGQIGNGSSSIIVMNSGQYSLQVTNDYNCTSNSTNTIDIISNEVPLKPTISILGKTTFCNGDSVILKVPSNSEYYYSWKNEFGTIADADSNVFVACSSGNYFVNVTNLSGCQVQSDTLLVNVLDKPQAPTILYSGNTTICNNDSVILFVNDNTNYSYQWKLNGGTVGSDSSLYIAKYNGIYSLQVSNSSNCIAESSNSVDVTVSEVPEKPVVSLSGPTNFCEGDSLILSTDEQAGVTYQWSNENGEILNANSNQYVIYTSGDFYLDITNSSNCTNTSAITNVVVAEMPPKPVINTTGYDASDCPQEKIITLTVDQPTVQYQYQWQRNGVSIDYETGSTLDDYLNEGDYSVIANNNGCAHESDITGIYYDHELPEKPGIIATGPNVWYLACTNDQALQYEWYYNNEIIPDENNYLHVANQNLGTYYVKIAEENGCFVSSDAVTIPLTATGIDDVNPFANLKIYPNPTPGVFTIEMDNNLFGELITRIFSQNAVEILNIKFDKSTKHFKAQVDLSGQGKGLYIISFVLDKYSAERKLIVE